MVQRDSDGNWILDPSRANRAASRQEHDGVSSDANFGSTSSSQDASLTGSNGETELQKLTRLSYKHNTRAHTTVPDLAPWDPIHVRYVLEQQAMYEQAQHGGFYATPPNHNLPHDVPRKQRVIPLGFQPPTGPKTNLPPGKRNSSPWPKVRSRDAIMPPSAASGGVPEPSPAYQLRASFLPRQHSGPQPLLVIIDLNGTLIHRPSAKSPRSFVMRPLAQEFLSYCIDTFHVMIWSSARPDNVAAMCDKLLTKSQLQRVVAVWGRDRFGLSSADYNSRVQCYKRLSAVWGDPLIRASYPSDHDDAGLRIDRAAAEEGRQWTPGSWNQGNTVLIDDSKEKARSEPYNAIEIPEFVGVEKEVVLPRVHDYLNTLACQADVSTYIRVHPFKPTEKP